MMLDRPRTISAISTPPGKGGVALIRTSGSDAVSIAARCFQPGHGGSLEDCRSRVAVYGDILLDGKKIDDGIAIVYRAPSSYTGEDMVEICCHGGVVVTRAVLRALYEAGSAPAEAGEFTRRAFMAGKLTLTEAEAIGELLEAGSIGQLPLFARGARTGLADKIGQLYDELLSVLSRLFAAIDFPDEDIEAFTDEGFGEELERIRGELSRLADSFDTGRIMTDGLPTVICGAPNVGKSSLYNLLCRSEEAIVTDIAGTTRDLLRSNVSLGSVTLRLCDTAGIREGTSDVIEQIGIERSLDELERAELIIGVIDASRPAEADSSAMIERLTDRRARGAKVILINNKCDLGDEYKIKDSADFDRVIDMSARSGVGYEALTAAVEELFLDGTLTPGVDPIVTTERQYLSLRRGVAAIDSALSALRLSGAPDAASCEVEAAVGELAELDGRAVSEEVVGRIFSKFCVGK